MQWNGSKPLLGRVADSPEIPNQKPFQRAVSTSWHLTFVLVSASGNYLQETPCDFVACPVNGAPHCMQRSKLWCKAGATALVKSHVQVSLWS